MSRRPARALSATALLAAVLAAAVGCGGSAKSAGPSSSSAPSAVTTSAPSAPGAVAAGSGYLALGDSVPFGFREQDTTPKPDYGDQASFVGYPEDVAAGLGLQVSSAACPGETTASFVTAGAVSNGCENSPGNGPAYRTSSPLHASYTGTQLAYAESYLKAHPDTRLVTLMIGANDGFICQETTKDKCASEVGTVFSTVQRNVGTILGGLRQQAGYQDQIVVVSYYSTDYSSALSNGVSKGLNSAVAAGAKPFDVAIADGYGTFQQAALQAGGDTCKAGLLTFLSTGKCGVHPSAAGQALLALAVEKAITR